MAPRVASANRTQQLLPRVDKMAAKTTLPLNPHMTISCMQNQLIKNTEKTVKRKYQFGSSNQKRIREGIFEAILKSFVGSGLLDPIH